MSKEKLRGPWPGPEGMIPEPPQNAADANGHNRRFLDSILIEMQIVDSVEADLKTRIFDQELATPIMMPAFSHLNKVGIEGRTPMEEYALAAKKLHTLNWIGMESDEEYRKIAAVGARNVRIIKPFASHEEIFKQIKVAEECGSVAVGIDIDHVFGKNGHYDIVDGLPLGPVTEYDLAQYVKATRLPFVAKGVLSVSDALKCQRAGVKAIFVSHHHGRMPFAMPPVAMLPAIRKAVGDDMSIFVDCGIDDGYDAYKALALGADAVSVGRGILPGLLKNGSQGVIDKVNKMNEQLAELMGYTNVVNTHSFKNDILYYGNKRLVEKNEKNN